MLLKVIDVHARKVLAALDAGAYNSYEYCSAYDAFCKALQAAPRKWNDRANVLSNRAAALIMMERYLTVAAVCRLTCQCDGSL